VAFDFGEQKYKVPQTGMVQGKLIDFLLKFTELKVYKGTTHITDEEENLNWRIELIREMVLRTGLKSMLG
jgi:hypothetical protein